jgi:hypothetical protein
MASKVRRRAVPKHPRLAQKGHSLKTAKRPEMPSDDEVGWIFVGLVVVIAFLLGWLFG